MPMFRASAFAYVLRSTSELLFGNAHSVSAQLLSAEQHSDSSAATASGTTPSTAIRRITISMAASTWHLRVTTGCRHYWRLRWSPVCEH